MIKRFFAVLMTLVIVTAAVLPASAATVSKTASAVRTYIIRNFNTAETPEQRFFLAAVGVMTQTDFPEVTQKESALASAQTILCKLAVRKAEEKETAILAAQQQDDGSFGDLISTLYSVIALTAAKQDFSSEKAVKYILSRQQEDGAFDSDLVLTARAVTVLCYFRQDAKVNSAVDKALGYILSEKKEDGSYGNGECTTTAMIMTAVCDAGLSPNTGDWSGLEKLLLNYQRKDGSFIKPNVTAETAKTEDLVADKDSTLMAYMAFDAAERGGNSVYLRLMEDGQVAKVHLKNIKYGLVAYGVFAVAAVVFWIVIFVRKPNKNKKEQQNF